MSSFPPRGFVAFISKFFFFSVFSSLKLFFPVRKALPFSCLFSIAFRSLLQQRRSAITTVCLRMRIAFQFCSFFVQTFLCFLLCRFCLKCRSQALTLFFRLLQANCCLEVKKLGVLGMAGTGACPSCAISSIASIRDLCFVSGSGDGAG